MRRSLQIVLMLLSLAGVFGGSHVLAAGGITVGFVPGQGLVGGEADARQFADLLAARLNTEVRIRLFNSEGELHQWLSRYREVDGGWLGDAFLKTLPAGDFLPLAGADNAAGIRLPGRFVVRQGVDARLLHQLREALIGFGEQPEEAALLANLQLARFVAVTGVAEAERPPLPATLASSAAPVMAEPAGAEPAQLPVAVPPPPVATAPPPQAAAAQSLPVTLAADRLDYDGTSELIRAGGAVVMQQGETTLAADELLWQEPTRDAAAIGNVRLAEPDAEMQGSSLHANLATGLGLARDGRVFLRERNFHLAGEEIERLGEATYRVREGRFTTCDGEIPDWRFTADDVDVTLGRYATARNVWFEIRNQPVVYLPYLLFPVKSERESGFLLPRAGYSSRKGGMLSLAWYEVIDRHLDATLYLDYLSRIGLGKGLEYRYVSNAAGAGEALLYHVSGRKENDDTFALKWRHSGDVPGGFRLTADVDYIEDIDFLEDFGETADEYAEDHTVSTIMLQRNWEKLNLSLLTEYIRKLDGSNDATLQRLPEINLSHAMRRLGDSPFFLQVENILTNFTRREGVDGLRLYVHPELSAPLKPGRWLELTPRVALYGRYYEVDDADDGLERGDYDNESLVAEYSLTASSRFARVFSFAHGGFDRLKHSIEPQVTYTYIPDASQDRLPYFGPFDRIGPANYLEYALINRLIGRAVDADGHRSYHELLNLRLSQLYDIAAARDDRADDAEEFSDLRVELQARPTPASSLNLEAWIPVYGDQRFSRITASASYAGRPGNTASLSYSYVREEDGAAAPSDYLEVNLATVMLAPVYVSFLERYDFRDGESLESLLNVEYRQKCWSLFLTLRSRPSLDDDEPDDNEIMIGFALSGLGRVGGFGSSLSSSR